MSRLGEKWDEQHLETQHQYSDVTDNSSEEQAHGTKDHVLPAKLATRIDMHVMPTLIVIYLASFLDR